MALSFRGGIEPEPDLKSRLRYTSIVNCLMPQKLTFSPGKRNITVSPDETVAIGQPLTDGEMPIYAGISGTVATRPDGLGGTQIEIIGDGLNTIWDMLSPVSKPLNELTREDITTLAKRFSVYDTRSGKALWKLISACKPAKRVIINCCETDFLTVSTGELVIESVSSLANGAKLLMKALDVGKAVFVCERDRKSVKQALESVSDKSGMFVAAEIELKYPICPETIYEALYGREIPCGKDSGATGCLIVSAETVIQLYESFVSGVPQIYKVFATGGKYMANPSIVRAPIGAQIRDIVIASGGLNATCDCFVFGSVMNGEWSDTLHRTVSVTTNQVLALQERPVRFGSCIRCGSCCNVCPMFLEPMRYAIALEKGMDASAYKYSELCLECGCCEYICPANVPLLQCVREQKSIRVGKEQL